MWSCQGLLQQQQTTTARKKKFLELKQWLRFIWNIGYNIILI